MLKEKFAKFFTNLKIGFKQVERQIEKSLNEITDEQPRKSSKAYLLDKIVSKFTKNHTKEGR